MPSWIMFIIVSIAAVASYVQIAKIYDIVDKPNERSSHTSSTYRGVGVVVSVLLLFFDMIYGLLPKGVVHGVLIAGITGFVDDLIDLQSSVRLLLYLGAISLCVFSFFPELTQYNLIFTFLSIIVITGVVNTFNFMDGINGITLSYSLLCLISVFTIDYLSYTNSHLGILTFFTHNSFLVFFLIITVILLCLNFRKKAIVFIGDSGSVVYGLICSIMVLKIIFETGHWAFVGLLLVYGIDSVGTIIFRLLKKENIFKPHRLHIYQMLANEKKWGHLPVSTLYFMAQLFINISLIFSVFCTNFLSSFNTLLLLTILFTTLYISLRKFYFDDLKLIYNIE